MALITRQQAVQIARDHAEREGWPFDEPVDVTGGHRNGMPTWEIVTSFATMGGNGRFSVDAKTGELLSAHQT